MALRKEPATQNEGRPLDGNTKWVSRFPATSNERKLGGGKWEQSVADILGGNIMPLQEKISTSSETANLKFCSWTS
uniref:Uncharacterized protein n=1 Tax=Timema bartmani TaxID=61472 RepID=A0A7R9I0W0_9NEOP|nr:unnamed protein product [Timema bartmani]